jgi:hypothetical protein
MVMQLPDDKPMPPQPRAPQAPQMPMPPGPPVGVPTPAPTPAPTNDQGTQTLPPDQIGDIPPPPMPQRPAPRPRPQIGVGGEQGDESTTFARPDSRGIRPYQSASPQRFGPGVPFAGGGASAGGGIGGEGDMGLTPEEAAELLQGLAMGMNQRGGGGI